MAKCDDKRPTSRAGEQKVETQAFKVEDLPADMGVTMTVYAGCIEGPRLTYGAMGPSRQVLALGTVDQIAKYSAGESVKVGDQPYQRNIGRKQEDAVKRIQDEMKTGDYTLTVNGQLLSPDSILNGYFTEQTATKDGQPVLRDGKPIKFFGGVELIVSAIIKPGSNNLDSL